jgi:hypothetical protein
VLAVIAVATVAWRLLPDDTEPSKATRTLPRGRILIHPARTPKQCLTEGRDRLDAYNSAVAVRLPCADVPLPRICLAPAGDGDYRIQWRHPQFGTGCLTVMDSGPVKGMLEPRSDCAHATRFLVEPTDTPMAGGYRIRPAPASAGLCIGIAEGDTGQGAEAVQERCTPSAADQQYIIAAQ